MRCQRLSLLNRHHERRGKSIPPSDDREPHTILDTAFRLDEQRPAEESHERTDFGRRAAPIVGGKCVERERSDARARRRFDDLPRRAHADAMPRRSRQTARLRPPTVAIHDDPDVNAVVGRRDDCLSLHVCVKELRTARSSLARRANESFHVIEIALERTSSSGDGVLRFRDLPSNDLVHVT